MLNRLSGVGGKQEMWTDQSQTHCQVMHNGIGSITCKLRSGAFFIGQWSQHPEMKHGQCKWRSLISKKKRNRFLLLTEIIARNSWLLSKLGSFGRGSNVSDRRPFSKDIDLNCERFLCPLMLLDL